MKHVNTSLQHNPEIINQNHNAEIHMKTTENGLSCVKLNSNIKRSYHWVIKKIICAQ